MPKAEDPNSTLLPRLLQRLPVPMPIGAELVPVAVLDFDQQALLTAIRHRYLSDTRFEEQLDRIMDTFFMNARPQIDPTTASLVRAVVDDVVTAAVFLTSLVIRIEALTGNLNLQTATDEALAWLVPTLRLCPRCGAIFIVASATRKFCGYVGCAEVGTKRRHRPRQAEHMRQVREHQLFADFQEVYERALGPRAPSARRVFEEYLAGNGKVEDFLESQADTRPQLQQRLARLSRYRTIRGKRR